MDSSVVLVRPEDSTGVKLLFSIPDQATKPFVFNSVALHPVREGGSITLKSLVGHDTLEIMVLWAQGRIYL